MCALGTGIPAAETEGGKGSPRTCVWRAMRHAALQHRHVRLPCFARFLSHATLAAPRESAALAHCDDAGELSQARMPRNAPVVGVADRRHLFPQAAWTRRGPQCVVIVISMAENTRERRARYITRPSFADHRNPAGSLISGSRTRDAESGSLRFAALSKHRTSSAGEWASPS
ncbi:hypothetical protein PSPO01_04209 [Paraphaeosphaeria sporulosa]